MGLLLVAERKSVAGSGRRPLDFCAEERVTRVVYVYASESVRTLANPGTGTDQPVVSRGTMLCACSWNTCQKACQAGSQAPASQDIGCSRNPMLHPGSAGAAQTSHA
eukprot:scaffold301_cov393-Prasinococcus_capsulatus_cf.AAC.13